MTKNLEKNYSWKFCYIFMIKNCNLLTVSLAASIKEVQATEVAFSPQKRTSNIKFLNFFISVGHHCCPPIRIQSGSGSETLDYECKQWHIDILYAINCIKRPFPDPTNSRSVSTLIQPGLRIRIYHKGIQIQHFRKGLDPDLKSEAQSAALQKNLQHYR